MRRVVLSVLLTVLLVVSGANLAFGVEDIQLYSHTEGQNYVFHPGAIGIARDSNGIVWFVDIDCSLVKVMPNDTIADWNVYKIPTQNNKTEVWDLDFDSHGNLWFIDVESNGLWVFNPSDESFTVYKLPKPSAYPIQMLIDQEENFWITELYASSLAKFMPSTKTFVEFATPTPSSGPS